MSDGLRQVRNVHSVLSMPFLRFHPIATNKQKYTNHKRSAHQGKFDKACAACKELRYKK